MSDNPKKIDRLVLSIATNQFKVPLPTGKEVVTAVNERDALLSEVAQLRAEALKGICVYCGYIEQYESLEQKASEAGNAMRVAHIRQCEARPEAKLIALSEQLIDEVTRLKDLLQPIIDCYGLGQSADKFTEQVGPFILDARAALAGKDR
jgi:hypothetical protein